jgi:hypothetical protein
MLNLFFKDFKVIHNYLILILFLGNIGQFSLLELVWNFPIAIS